MPNPNQAVSSPSGRPQARSAASTSVSGASEAQATPSTVTNVSQAMMEAAPAAVSSAQSVAQRASTTASSPTVALPSAPIAARARARLPGLEAVEGYRPNPRSRLWTLVEQRGEESAEQAAEEANFVNAPDAIFASPALGNEELFGGLVRAIRAGARIVSAVASAVETTAQIPSLVEVVIGEDDRTRIDNTSDEPFSGICQLNIRAANGAFYRGKGWCIGPRCVITAGHCVYMHDAGGWVTSITVAPGRDANMYPFPSLTSERFETTNNWVSSRSRDGDYAAIFLPAAFDAVGGTAPYQFTYASLDDSQLSDQVLNVVGYSADNPPEKDGTKQWFHARRATRLTTSRLEYDADTGGGASGCAVYIYPPAGPRTCVGIHTNGSDLGNSAVRITAEVAENLNRWRQASET